MEFILGVAMGVQSRPLVACAASQKDSMQEVTYTYAWGNNSKRAEMKGRPCRILHTLSKGSVYIEFTDNNQREVTSRRALRREMCQK